MPTAVVGGKVVRFTLSPALASAVAVAESRWQSGIRIADLR
jgi:hypothetical protein